MSNSLEVCSYSNHLKSCTIGCSPKYCRAFTNIELTFNKHNISSSLSWLDASSQIHYVVHLKV